MKDQNLNKSILKSLENLELAGITFIRDYIQFLFDGPFLNTYTLPDVKIQNNIISSTVFGYHDTLCSLIGKKVLLSMRMKRKKELQLNLKIILSFLCL